MLVKDITGNKINIHFNHFEASMSQYLLQRENITTLHQVLLGKRMTESVRVSPCVKSVEVIQLLVCYGESLIIPMVHALNCLPGILGQIGKVWVTK